MPLLAGRVVGSADSIEIAASTPSAGSLARRRPSGARNRRRRSSAPVTRAS
jgi:hypothetical protein